MRSNSLGGAYLVTIGPGMTGAFYGTGGNKFAGQLGLM